MTMERALVRASLFAILSALACGEAAPAPDYLLHQTFDEECEALPCGWTQVAGTAGQASLGGSFHPGERALILDGEGIVVRGPGGDPGSAMVVFGSLQARIAARCEESAVLGITLTLGETVEAGVPRTAVLRGNAVLGERWEAILVTLVSDGAFADAGSTSPISGPVRITGLTLTKSGGGRCMIGEITIDDVGTLDPVTDPSC